MITMLIEFTYHIVNIKVVVLSDSMDIKRHLHIT